MSGHRWGVATDEQAERRRLLVATTLVVVAAIAHRAILFLLHRVDLHALSAANPNWYAPQNLPREMLRDHLAQSLLMLQHFPPVSNVLLAVALKTFTWPDGVAEAMIWLQTLFSILTAGVLIHLLSMLYPRRPVLWTLIGLAFVINTDLVVLEYYSLGQTIYEPVTMFLALLLLDLLVGLRRTGRLRCAAIAGVVMGLLTLTRQTWSFFPPVYLVLAALLAPARRGSAVLACLFPILLLQGGWAVKNRLVWGYLSPVTSSWGGLSAINGLRNAGLANDFDTFRRTHVTAERGFPPWRVAAAQESILGVSNGAALRALPSEILARDEAVQRVTGLANPMPNTLAFRYLCAATQGDFLAFMLAHPTKMLGKMLFSYRIFWQPIANCGRMFIALFAVDGHLTNAFDFPETMRKLVAGILPDRAYVMSGSSPYTDRLVPRKLTPTRLFTLRGLELVVLMLNVVGIHLLLPLVGLLWLAHRVRYGATASPLFGQLRMSALFAAAVCYAYFATLVSLVETSETMRYRLEVEPIIWVMTVICLGELAGLIRRRVARSASERRSTWRQRGKP